MFEHQSCATDHGSGLLFPSLLSISLYNNPKTLLPRFAGISFLCFCYLPLSLLILLLENGLVSKERNIMGQGSSSCSVASCTNDISNQITSHSITTCKNDLTLFLPDECLATVFGKLSCQDRNACSLVCKRWCLIDSKSRNHLVLLAPSEMSTSLPALLSRFSSLSVLSLKCSRKLVSIADDSLARIPQLLVSLKKLKLKGCVDVSDDGLRAFALHRPHFLTKLSFASCGFGAKGINALLTNCPSLQDLTLKRLRKLDSQNTSLSLSSHNEENVVKDKRNGLIKTELQRLCIKDLHNSRLFIPLLSACSGNLKTLIVCRSSGNWDKVMEETLRDKISSISEIQMENVQMGDAGLTAITSACPGLQVLYISRSSDCTDDGLSAIANSCKKLRKLHIDAWSRFGSRTIGDQGVFCIASKCCQLQEIVLMGVPISISTLTVLSSNCQALERLALCNSDSVKDKEIAYIASKFHALKKLCIKNCPISDFGMEAFIDGCPNLEKLKVKRCRGISQASVWKLRKQRSELVVSVDTAGSSALQDGQRIVPGEEEEQGIGGRRMATAFPSTATDVNCSSRSALMLRSKFLQVGRRRPHQHILSSTPPNLI